MLVFLVAPGVPKRTQSPQLKFEAVGFSPKVSCSDCHTLEVTYKEKRSTVNCGWLFCDAKKSACVEENTCLSTDTSPQWTTATKPETELPVSSTTTQPRTTVSEEGNTSPEPTEAPVSKINVCNAVLGGTTFLPIVPDPENCTRYYFCRGKRNGILINCPENEVFNAEYGICMESGKCTEVDCSSEPRAQYFGFASNLEFSVICTSNDSMSLIACNENSNGQRKVFDDSLSKCVDPCTAEGIHPYPNRCDKYVHCVPGELAGQFKREVRQCPEGTGFQGKICVPNECDHETGTITNVE